MSIIAINHLFFNKFSRLAGIMRYYDGAGEHMRGGDPQHVIHST